MFAITVTGVGVTLHHYRTNSECGRLEELPPIEQNLQYDFNYQQYTTLPESVQILPVSVQSIRPLRVEQHVPYRIF